MPKAKKTTPHDWVVPFMQLRTNIRPMVLSGVKLYHGVILSGVGDTHAMLPAADELEPAYEAPLLRPIVTVNVANDTWAHHCFYGHNRTALVQMEKELTSLDRWLKNTPNGLLPEFRKPSKCLHSTANLITWMCILYHLAWRYNDDTLQAVLECSDSDVDTFYDLWDRHPASSVCDPAPLLTCSNATTKAVWVPGGKAEDRELPLLVSAYLPMNVLQASANAVLLLKYYGVKPKPLAKPGTVGESAGCGEVHGPQASIKTNFRERANLLLNRLIEHHFPLGDEVNKEPLTQTEMAVKVMGWETKDQYKIHRLLQVIFTTKSNKKPGKETVKKMYRELVLSGEIERFALCYQNVNAGFAQTKGHKEYADGKTVDSLASPTEETDD